MLNLFTLAWISGFGAGIGWITAQRIYQGIDLVARRFHVGR